jgi:molecular chaperone GrpE
MDTENTTNTDLSNQMANAPTTEMPTEAAPPAADQTTAATPAETAKLQDELAEMKDKYLRLFADFENFRRRTAKERLELIQTAGEKVLKELLAVLDDFDRAEKSFREKDEKEAAGFFLIHSKFKKVLEAQGVKVMDTSSGVFDPDLHDAITQVPAPGEDARGKILDVVEKGYLLNDKVIRHAKVVIGS